VRERSSQNGPWRFECSHFTSKNVIYVVHVLVKRSKTFKITPCLLLNLQNVKFQVQENTFDFRVEPRTFRYTSDDVKSNCVCCSALRSFSICDFLLCASDSQIFGYIFNLLRNTLVTVLQEMKMLWWQHLCCNVGHWQSNQYNWWAQFLSVVLLN